MIDHGALIAEGAPRALIARHIEPDVVEVYGDDAGAWRDRVRADPQIAASTRFETTGETVFAYTEDARPLLAQLGDRQERVRYLHRPADFEDLLLKLTGREMRE